jgi:ubiquinone biosynthesis protein
MNILYLFFAIPAFILFAWAARRLLGVVQLSMTKTVIAALVGLGISDILSRSLLKNDVDRDEAILIGLVIGFAATMVVIIGFEAFGSRRTKPVRTGPRNPIGTVQQGFANAKRSTQIAQIAAKHGLGKGFGLALSSTISEEEAQNYGIRLREAFEEAGGVFVKLGQLLATRPDVISQATADELALLHQDVEPAPRSDIEPALEVALGNRMNEAFTDFDWDPIGAGSLGQVYRATTISGEKVVVKVRRPGIEAAVERDLRIAIDFASFAEERISQAEQLGVTGLAEQFARQLRGEMDYTVEARNTVECAVVLAAHGNTVTPNVYEKLSGESVLTISYLEGETLGRHGVVGGDHGRGLADSLFEAEVESMLSGQRFHADPHPGNVMLLPDGRLGLIDFGSADRLDAYERSAITDILAGLALNDATMLRTAALEMGMGGTDIDPGQLDRAFAKLMAEHLGPGATPGAELLQDFLVITNEFGLIMPTAVTGMLRAMATMQGSLEILSPDYPIIEAAQKVAKSEMINAIKPENLTDEFKKEITRLAPILRRAPHHLDRIAGQLEDGNLAFRVRMFTDPDDVSVLSRLINRGVLAFIGASLGVVSTMLLQIDSGLPFTSNIDLLELLGYIGLFFGSVLIMRVVLDILRDR